MAKCVIIIEDLDPAGKTINISASSDPQIVPGEQLTFAQQLVVDLMRSFRDHFEESDIPSDKEGYN